MFVKSSLKYSAKLDTYADICFGKHNLKCVTSFEYVGITFSCNGLFHEDEELLLQNQIMPYSRVCLEFYVLVKIVL